MNLILVLCALWVLVIGFVAFMVFEEIADRKRERAFVRQLRDERLRMAERYGFKV